MDGLEISTNGITIILGPNGSGKTLLTKIIKGLIKPERGAFNKVKWNNSQYGISFTKYNFLRRNVFNNLAYPQK